jgi:ribosomal protein L37AE/L43A
LAIDEYLEEEILEGLEPCPMCDVQNERMGRLGNLMWHRCRACGWEYSMEIPDDKEDSESYWDRQ